MIVKDEEWFLDQCLDSVDGYVDEIIIVDTGSSDATKEIARSHTDKIYDFEWEDDFSAARNFSLGKAVGDWILVLDADEVIAEEDLRTINDYISDSEHDVYSFIQRNYSNDPHQAEWSPVEQKTRYSKDYTGYKKNPIVRLFRNREDIKYHGVIHEIIDHHAPGIRAKMTELPIHHYIDENPAKNQKSRQFNYLRIIEKELKEKPSGRLYCQAGAVCMNHKKDYRQALEYLQKAADLNYEREKCLEGVAEAYYRLEDYKEAYGVYTRLVESNYLTPTLCNNLTNLLVRAKDYHTALRILELALGLEHSNQERIARIRSNIEAIGKMIENQPGLGADD